MDGPHGSPIQTIKKTRKSLEFYFKKWISSNFFLENTLGNLDELVSFHWSSIYLTTPRVQGFSQSKYFNAVLVIKSNSKLPLHPSYSLSLSLLKGLLRLEKDLGRTREVKQKRWCDRCIDIDLLSWGDFMIQTKDLKLPHPRLMERDFVLVPMAEVIVRVLEDKPKKLNNHNEWG